MAATAKKNAFEIMFESSKLCWPPGPLPFAITSILEIVSENGWFPWYDNDEVRQNPDYSSLRLVTKEMKALWIPLNVAVPILKPLSIFST